MSLVLCVCVILYAGEHCIEVKCCGVSVNGRGCNVVSCVARDKAS